ncbi:MAG: ABC transporter substrate-binding protein [Proteobacteria bacterium]|nr:ABC transporter substrate-binding protein [Pseudomonadota bacterium]
MKSMLDRRGFLAAVGGAAACVAGGVRAQQGTDPSVSRTEILLGQSAVLSGQLGDAALAVQAGARLVIDDANANGGVAGRALRLVSLDDELNPEKALANYRSLVLEQKVLACVCGTGAAPTMAGAGVLRENGVPLIGASAVTDSVRDKTRGVAYYVRASSLRELEALVQHLTTLGMSRIAFIHLATAGGEEIKAQMQQVLAAQKLQLHASAGVGPDGAGAQQAAQLLATSQPQAVVLFMSGAAAGAVMKATWQLGAAPTFYGMSIVSGETAARMLGAQFRGLAVAQVTPYPWDGADPDAIRFRRLAQAANVPVNYHSYEGYLAGRVTVDALQRTGRELTRERLHASLRGMKTRVAGMDIDFTNNHHTGSRFVELVQVRPDGRYVR